MRVLFDTSLIVAASVERHPHHPRALPWLQRAVRGEVEAVVSAHTLAEVFATLTTLPVEPRITPAAARESMRENLGARVRRVALTPREYDGMLDLVAAHALAGGIVYDAVILRAAKKARVDRVLTFNEKDFRRLAPLFGVDVVVP